MSASDDAPPNHAFGSTNTRRTRPDVKFRLGPAIRTDRPPHSTAIYPCLYYQPPVEDQPHRYSGSPLAAHRQVEDQGGCQPEPDVSHYCRAGIRNTVTSTTPGGPRHSHNADRHHTRDARHLYVLSKSCDAFVPCSWGSSVSASSQLHFNAGKKDFGIQFSCLLYWPITQFALYWREWRIVERDFDRNMHSSFCKRPPSRSPIRSSPIPWGSGAGDWDAAYKKAIEVVKQLTLEEKVNLTTGSGWQQEQCVGQTGGVPRLGIRGQCLQDSPVGVRYTDLVSVFPAGINVGATWDKRLAYERGKAMGEESRDKGVTVQLGPVAGGIGRSPEGGRNWEGFSPDPYLTGKLFADSIRGIQSTGVQACAKHFVGNEQEHFRQTPEAVAYGFNITEPGSSNIDDQTMHEIYAWPFADAVKAGVASFMCSYNLLNNSQACQNSYLLNHILKEELGFQGYVMSDWQATAAGVPAVLAGLDMTMAGDIRFGDGDSYFGPNLTIAVLNGTVPQWRLDDMVVRILAGWYLVDPDDSIDLPNFQSWTPYTNGAVHAHVGPTWGTGVVNQHVDVRQKHGELIRHIGAASTVLLKNTKGALPLTNKEKLTAVIGEDAGSNPLGPNGCRNHGCDVGTLGVGWGSGQADFPYLISPDAALQHEVTSRYGSYQSITNNSAFTQIDILAKRVTEVGGVCLVFANADSGEGFINIENNFGDRKNLTLWQGADTMIANVSASCNNTVLVLHTVGAVEIDQYKDNENITAILWAGLPGEQSGNAIADVLYGRVNPGAKLPFTIGKERSDYGTDVLYTPNQDVPQYNFQEGVFIDYRTFDHRNITPVYEFGFGLSYTTFEYSDISVQKLDAAPYEPNSGSSGPAPTYGTIDNRTSAHTFPEDITRIPLYIYPWLNSTSLNASYGAAGYGDNSFIPEGARDGSKFTYPPASGPNGGNPGLWEDLYTVTVKVTNTGDVDGDEVPQLYLSLGGPYDPKVILRGFERVHIKAGETTEVSFDLARRDVSNWSTEKQDWVVTEYEKTVYVGSSSRQLHLSAKLE